jgi:hypothetical protein
MVLQQSLVLVNLMLCCRSHASGHVWVDIAVIECLRLLDRLEILLEWVDIGRVRKVVNDELGVLLHDALVFDEVLHCHDVVANVTDLVEEFLLALHEEIFFFIATAH